MHPELQLIIQEDLDPNAGEVTVIAEDMGRVRFERWSTTLAMPPSRSDLRSLMGTTTIFRWSGCRLFGDVTV